MNRKFTFSPENGTIPFCSLALIDKGLIINTKKKEEKFFLFSEINKIYIRKNKFSFFNKVGLIFLLVLHLVFFSFYFPIEIILLISILFIPLIVKINTHKKYQLHIYLQNGSYYIKDFKTHTKQEYINFVNLVRKEIFSTQITFNIPTETLETETSTVDYSFTRLTIA